VELPNEMRPLPSALSRPLRTVVITILTLLAPAGQARPDSSSTQPALTETQVKAAFLFNFTKFVGWAAGDRPLGICIVGNQVLATAASDVVRGAVVGGRPVTALAPAVGSSFSACDLLYIGDVKADEAAAILARVRGPVLTVGETPRFLRDGGMVRVFIEDNRLRFQVNRKQTEAAGIKISSQLMQLASQ
jgi:hypothetical protein